MRCVSARIHAELVQKRLQRLCCSLRNGRNYKSLERACALLEGRGQEMIDACAVKALSRPRYAIRAKRQLIVTERDIRDKHR